MNSCATVNLSPEEECYVALLIEKRRNVEKIPKRIAVFAIVKK